MTQTHYHLVRSVLVLILDEKLITGIEGANHSGYYTMSLTSAQCVIAETGAIR
jgi:hypothetical protein